MKLRLIVFGCSRFMPVAMLLIAAVLAGSCGPKVIKGRPPFTDISGMHLDDGTLAADFGIRNRNGVGMNIDRMEFVMRVEQTELLSYEDQSSLEIPANGTEKVHIEAAASESASERLRSLEQGQVSNLPFVLEGGVHTLEDGYLAFEQKGHLYPVPGRPGRFRSTVAYSKELRREKPY